MFARMIAIVISTWLPTLVVILPVSAAHRINGIVAGVAATALAAFSLVEERARTAAALVGAWVALSAFVFRSTLTEQIVTVSWGVAMFVFLAGPFSQAPGVTWARPAKSEPIADDEVFRAAA